MGTAPELRRCHNEVARDPLRVCNAPLKGRQLKWCEKCAVLVRKLQKNLGNPLWQSEYRRKHPDRIEGSRIVARRVLVVQRWLKLLCPERGPNFLRAQLLNLFKRAYGPPPIKYSRAFYAFLKPNLHAFMLFIPEDDAPVVPKRRGMNEPPQTRRMDFVMCYFVPGKFDRDVIKLIRSSKTFEHLAGRGHYLRLYLYRLLFWSRLVWRSEHPAIVVQLTPLSRVLKMDLYFVEFYDERIEAFVAKLTWCGEDDSCLSEPLRRMNQVLRQELPQDKAGERRWLAELDKAYQAAWRQLVELTGNEKDE